MRLAVGLLCLAVGAGIVGYRVRDYREQPREALREDLWNLALSLPTDLWMGLGLLAFGAGLTVYELSGGS